MKPLLCLLSWALCSSFENNYIEDIQIENRAQLFSNEVNAKLNSENGLILSLLAEIYLKREHSVPTDVIQAVSEVVMELRKIFSEERVFYDIKNVENTDIAGRFIATAGYFQDIGSIEVHGNIEFADNTAPKPSLVIVPMAFRDFELGFRTYTLDLANMSQTGSVKITAGRHKLKMMLEIKSKPYSLLLLDLVFDEIDNIKVSLVGLDKKYTKIKKNLTSWIIKNCKMDFQRVIVNKLKYYLVPMFPK